MTEPTNSQGSLRRLAAVAAVLCLTIVGSLAVGIAPASAGRTPPSACPKGQVPTDPPGPCSMTLGATSGYPGNWVPITDACGFEHSIQANVVVTMSPAKGKTFKLITVPTYSTGCISGFGFSVPSGAKPGVYTVAATGPDPSGATYQLVAAFEVLAP